MSTIVDRREQSSSPCVQGVNEEIAYSFDFSRSRFQVTGKAEPAIEVFDWSVNPPVDMSTLLLSSTDATVQGDIATMTGVLRDLSDGVEYRLFCRCVSSSDEVGETYYRIYGKL